MKILDLKNASRGWFWSVFLFAIFVETDQLAKTHAPNIFKNNAFAFSLPLPGWLMYLTYAAVLSGMVYYCARNYHDFNFLSRLAWILIFSGAFSNIIESMVLGYVRDFIYITFRGLTGVYNLADGFIIIGVIILLAQSYKNQK